jgi:hypothetical protein
MGWPDLSLKELFLVLIQYQRDIVGVFCTGKIYGSQDHVFLFQSGLMNYKELQSTL